MMQFIRRHRLSPAMIVAIVALVGAFGGSAIAGQAVDLAKKKLNGSTIKSRSISGSKLKRNTLGGTQIKESKLGKVPSATNADKATTATNATNADNATNSSTLGGSAASDYQKFGSTLSPGRSESGDYGIRTPNTNTSGFLALSASFPIPLATRIPAARIVYTGPSGTTHCSGPGNAERGYLCIYQINSSNVNTPPNVSAFENASPQEESGNFGFNMEWTVTGASAFSIGTWTVTAP